MRIRLSQLRQIIAEEARRVARGDWSQEKWDAYNKEHDESSDSGAEEKAAARKPVPDQAVKYVVENYYDNTDGKGKWWKMKMEDAVEKLLTSFGYNTPGRKDVSFEDLDQVKAVLRKDKRYFTTGGVTSESMRRLRRLLRDY